MDKSDFFNHTSEVPFSLSEQWFFLLHNRSYLYEGLVYQDFLKAAVEISQSRIGYFHLLCEEQYSGQI